MFETLKNAIRVAEARLTPRHTQLRFGQRPLSFHRSIWWVNESQADFDAEIAPYFAAVERPPAEVKVVLDAGAATGLFAVAAAAHWPGCRVHCFEPSQRQRILLERNLRLNGIPPERVTIDACGLWNREAALAFRTIGAMSAFEEASELAGRLSFGEQVPVVSLDHWAERRGLERLDLIKMDIEGAEIEALQGAERSLARWRPELLVMAYHLREGTRAYERCAEFLASRGYRTRELPGVSGFLHAVAA